MEISFEKKRILLTAGPTRAYLDSVRYLSNYSTGKLAYEIAAALCRRGAEVHLIAGPTSQNWDELGLAEVELVETTAQMHRAVMERAELLQPEVGIFAAAVLDFEPVSVVEGKISSENESWRLDLKPTPKILDEVGERFPKMRRIGFKLECEKHSDPQAYASEYLERKGLDILCLNYLPEITSDRHPAVIVSRVGQTLHASSKQEIAECLTRSLF